MTFGSGGALSGSIFLGPDLRSVRQAVVHFCARRALMFMKGSLAGKMYADGVCRRVLGYSVSTIVLCYARTATEMGHNPVGSLFGTCSVGDMGRRP